MAAPAARALDADICVVGGGPAGAAIAHQLAVRGHAVVVVEAQPFPRAHVAASLPATILPLLDALGVRDRIEAAGFVRSARPVIRWPAPETTGDPALWENGLHIDRAEFDDILLAHARRASATILQPARVVRTRRLEDRGWEVAVATGDQLLATVRARVLVDASGRSGIPRRSVRSSPRLLAMFTHVARDTNAGAAGRIEATRAEWIWLAPVTATTSVCAVFLDPRRLAGEPRASIERTFHALVAASPLVAAHARLSSAGPVQFRDATSRAATGQATLDLVRIGDASVAIDPLSSQGVQMAIATALQGAVVVHTLLRGGADAEAAAAFYEERQRERQELHRLRTAAAYQAVARQSDHQFWHERAVGAPDQLVPDVAAGVPDAVGLALEPDCVLRLSPSTTFELMPVIAGDVVRRVLAVRAPRLPRPVAFLGGIELGDLLVQTTFNRRAAVIGEEWQLRQPGSRSWEILSWLWARGVVSIAP